MQTDIHRRAQLLNTCVEILDDCREERVVDAREKLDDARAHVSRYARYDSIAERQAADALLERLGSLIGTS